MRQLAWTLVTLGLLGGSASAEDEGVGMTADVVTRGTSHRGISQDYLVMPAGGEVGAQMRFVMADRMLDGDGLKFTDLALFTAHARWSLFSRLELSVAGDFLPKQPSQTNEKPWQSASVGLRTPLGKRAAIALGGAGGHLMNHAGMWTRESLTLQWRTPIAEDIMLFDIETGLDGLGLQAPNTQSTAFVAEVMLKTQVIFRDPHGYTGGWVGIQYALPVQATGKDPTTERWIDPQPRLDFHLGGVLSLVKNWDVFVDFAVIDRGDRADPTTQLPILDGGFDQKQIMFGVTRHLTVKRHRTYDGGDPILIGSR